MSLTWGVRKRHKMGNPTWQSRGGEESSDIGFFSTLVARSATFYGYLSSMRLPRDSWQRYTKRQEQLTTTEGRPGLARPEERPSQRQ